MRASDGALGHESIDFASYGAALDATPDLELADLKVTSAEAELLVTEEMLSCTSGMLLCLDREQRLTFILGAIFEVSDTVAAEVLEITPDNFRQRLARVRRDLRNFMNDKCGLVNQANPCRCAKKTRGFIQAGMRNDRRHLTMRCKLRPTIIAGVSSGLSQCIESYETCSQERCKCQPPIMPQRSYGGGRRGAMVSTNSGDCGTALASCGKLAHRFGQTNSPERARRQSGNPARLSARERNSHAGNRRVP